MSEYQDLLNNLRPQHRKFVAAYVEEPVAKKAAIAAGYSEKSAEAQGFRMLRNARVKEAIDAGLEEVAEQSKLRAVDLAKMLFEDYQTCRIRVPKTTYNSDGKEVQAHDFNGNPAWKLIDAACAARFADMLMKHIGGYREDNRIEGRVKFMWEGDEEQAREGDDA